jgi:hypothetical protein
MKPESTCSIALGVAGLAAASLFEVQRVIPLWKTTAAQLRGWLDQISADPQTPGVPQPGRSADDPLRHPRPPRPCRRC